MFSCKKCGHQSETFEVYSFVPQRWCIHCLQDDYEISSYAFTGHPINCLFLNKKRCPELRKLLSEKQWIAAVSIKGTRVPKESIPRSTLLTVWKDSLWDFRQAIILDDKQRAFNARSKKIAGIAKVLGIPLVEYRNVAYLEYVRFNGSRVEGFLEEGSCQPELEVCA